MSPAPVVSTGLTAGAAARTTAVGVRSRQPSAPSVTAASDTPYASISRFAAVSGAPSPKRNAASSPLSLTTSACVNPHSISRRAAAGSRQSGGRRFGSKETYAPARFARATAARVAARAGSSVMLTDPKCSRRAPSISPPSTSSGRRRTSAPGLRAKLKARSPSPSIVTKASVVNTSGSVTTPAADTPARASDATSRRPNASSPTLAIRQARRPQAATAASTLAGAPPGLACNSG